MIPDDVSSFTQRLARARILRGYTQKSLATKIQVAQMTIGRWERGLADPTPAHLKALADALDVPVLWLASGEGPEPIF